MGKVLTGEGAMPLGRENQLLAALPATVYKNWKGELVLRELKQGQSLNLNRKQGEVYFPISCAIAIYATNTLGRRTFMRFVGPSFAAGLVNMIATDNVVFDRVVCGSGYAIAVPSEVVRRSIDTPPLSGEAQSIAMARTARGGLVIAQCMGSHTTKQRLAQLLLRAHDCFGAGRPVTLTQHSLGEMLMARRERAAEILAELKQDGLIESRRGAIHLRSVDKLKQASCECYSWVQQSYVDEHNLWESFRWLGA